MSCVRVCVFVKCLKLYFRAGRCFRVTEILVVLMHEGILENKGTMSEEHMNAYGLTTSLYLEVRNCIAGFSGGM